MTRFEKGYLVSAIDMEGNISLEFTNSRLPTHGFGCCVCFTNTHVGGANYVKDLFEKFVGHPLILKPYKPGGNRKPKLTLSIHRQEDVLKVLSFLIPHLKIKREQAVVLYDHLVWRRQQPNIDKNGRQVRFPSEVYRRDNQIKALLNRLNRRGQFLDAPRVCTDYTEAS